jgi:DNA-binding Lrp family transcriptional regulator
LTKRILSSKLDKQIVKILLSSDGGKMITSKEIARRLGIPATTAQRRRKRLEREVLTVKYGLDLKKFGWHKIQFFVATTGGKTTPIAEQIAKMNHIVYVSKSMGDHAIDLHVIAVVNDNSELLDVMEQIRSVDGVKDATWTESIQPMATKMSVPPDVIDSL